MSVNAKGRGAKTAKGPAVEIETAQAWKVGTGESLDFFFVQGVLLPGGRLCVIKLEAHAIIVVGRQGQQ